MSNAFKQYLQLKEDLNKIPFDIPLGNVLSQALVNLCAPQKQSALKSTLKNLYYLFFLEKQYGPIATRKDLATMLHCDREDLRRNYVKALDLLGVKAERVFTKKFSPAKSRPSVYWSHDLTRKVLRVVEKKRKLSFTERCSFAIFLNYRLKRVRYLQRILKDFGGSTYYCASCSVDDEALFAMLLMQRGVKVVSFQHAGNVYIDKSHLESNYQQILNLNCDVLHVWGSAYAKIYAEYNPRVTMKVLGHPLYKDRKISPPKITQLCVFLDGPENIDINARLIALGQDIGRQLGRGYFLKRHPADAGTYAGIVDADFKGFVNGPIAAVKNTVCLVHNSSALFDLLFNNYCLQVKLGKNDMALPEGYPFVINESSKVYIDVENAKQVNKTILREYYGCKGK